MAEHLFFLAGSLGSCGDLEHVFKFAPILSQWTTETNIEDWFYNMTVMGTKMAHTISILTLWII
jgi:hypothetical protein